MLIDAAQLPESAVRNVAVRVAGIESINDVRTRGAPGELTMDLRACVDPHLSIEAAHVLSHALADALRRAFPDVVDVVVHTEPADPPAAPEGRLASDST